LLIVDLTIVGFAILLLSVSASLGAFRRGRVPRTGRFVLIAGIVTTAMYYLADLVVITLVPVLYGPEASLQAMSFLLQHVRVPATLVSFALIATGAMIAARSSMDSEKNLVQSDARAAKAIEIIVDSENRFRSLVEQYSDSVYCFEFDPPIDTSLPIEEQISRTYSGVLVECNTAYAKAVGSSDKSEILGKSYGGMDGAFGNASHDKLARDLIQGGYRLDDYEVHSVNADGERRALMLNVTGVVHNGALVRVWGSEKDVLAKLEAESKLRDRARFQEVVASISSRLITTPEDALGETIEGCLRLACKFAASDRVTLIWFHKAECRAELLYYWNELGGPPWVDVPIAKFPWISEQTLNANAVAIDEISALPDDIRDKQLLSDLGLKSLAVLPLVIGGEVAGSCGFGNIEKSRIWTSRQLQDLQVVSDLLANVIDRLNSKKTLDRVLDELRQSSDRLQAENVYLRQEIRSTHGFNELVGESDELIACLQQVAQVAATNTTVLILGETGTGKELIARAIHERSDRSDRALVKVNCAALPQNLVESELFGHVKGAFTGADSRKRGRFDLADGGTLFLDEIGDLPLDLQGKLLRVLQEGEFERVGGSESIKVDVRILAATNRRLQEAVDHGDFRADLFYRINTFPITLPALRERKSDIPMLVEHFIAKHAQPLGREVNAVSTVMMDHLQAFSWPGNVRELESVVQRALISSDESVLQLAEPLDVSLRATLHQTVGTVDNPLDLRAAEKEHIASILGQTDWKIAGPGGAAAKLGVPPSTLRSKMKKLGLRKSLPGTTGTS